MKTLQKKSIVAFHVGRGGRFNNEGFLTYLGEKRIDEFTGNLFTNYKNQYDIFKKIKGLKNLEAKYYECCDTDDFSFFDERLGLEIGEKIYTDCNGEPVGLTEKECESGIGCINIDNRFDTTYCKYFEDCDDIEIELINKESTR